MQVLTGLPDRQLLTFNSPFLIAALAATLLPIGLSLPDWEPLPGKGRDGRGSGDSAERGPVPGEVRGHAQLHSPRPSSSSRLLTPHRAAAHAPDPPRALARNQPRRNLLRDDHRSLPQNPAAPQLSGPAPRPGADHGPHHGGPVRSRQGDRQPHRPLPRRPGLLRPVQRGPAPGRRHRSRSSSTTKAAWCRAWKACRPGSRMFVIDLGGSAGGLGSQPERTVFQTAQPACAWPRLSATNRCTATSWPNTWPTGPPSSASSPTTAGGPTRRATPSTCSTPRSAPSKPAATWPARPTPAFRPSSTRKAKSPGKPPWWVQDASRATVHLNTEQTFYVRHGELIGPACQVLAVLLLLATAGAAVAGRKRVLEGM